MFKSILLPIMLNDSDAWPGAFAAWREIMKPALPWRRSIGRQVYQEREKTHQAKNRAIQPVGAKGLDAADSLLADFAAESLIKTYALKDYQNLTEARTPNSRGAP